jgi:hypothetical protein
MDAGALKERVASGSFARGSGSFFIQPSFIYEPPLCDGRKEEDARSTESAEKMDAARRKRTPTDMPTLRLKPRPRTVRGADPIAAHAPAQQHRD